MLLTVDSPWAHPSLEEVGDRFRDAPFRWWIAGGYALELHTGRSWRSHSDLDVSVLRSDLSAMRTWLSDLDLHVAAAGVLSPWDGRPLDITRDENNLWCARPGADSWLFDILISEGDAQEWIYRRDTSIRRPWPEAVLRSSSGLPYLAPDLQLLFKSTSTRPKDDHDRREMEKQSSPHPEG